MSCFLPADQTDFARGLLARSKTATFDFYVDQRCEGCVERSDRSRVGRLLPPARHLAGGSSGKYPKACVAYKSWRRLVETARWADLNFDSLRQTALSPVRGSTSSSRRLVYKAEPLVIDVRLETDAVQGDIFVIGQILNSDHPDGLMCGIDVILLNGEGLIAKTIASSSGEFELQCARERNLRLFINIRGQRAIGIVLPDIES